MCVEDGFECAHERLFGKTQRIFARCGNAEHVDQPDRRQPRRERKPAQIFARHVVALRAKPSDNGIKKGLRQRVDIPLQRFLVKAKRLYVRKLKTAIDEAKRVQSRSIVVNKGAH